MTRWRNRSPRHNVRCMRPAPRDRDDPLRVQWRIFVGAFFAAFVLRFGYLYLDDLARARPGTFSTRFLLETTGSLAAAFLFLGVVWLERRYPLDDGRWRTNISWQVLGLALYSVMHTTLITGMREILFPFFRIGTYDTDSLSIRYLREVGPDMVSYAAFIAVLTLLRMQRRLHRERLQATELARDVAEARLEALGLRLQPHFLFNALNTISSAVYDDPVAADTMIGHLGDLLRHALRTADRPEISVAEEIEVLQAYLAIVDARFGDRIECELHVNPAARTYAVPAFLLQPLVENAVRHGAAMECNVSHVSIRITVEGPVLHLVIENDIASLVTERVGTGTGLGTTTDRLRLLYGNDQQLAAGPVAGGTRFRVAIQIPARSAPTAQPVAQPTHFAQTEISHASFDRR